MVFDHVERRFLIVEESLCSQLHGVAQQWEIYVGCSADVHFSGIGTRYSELCVSVVVKRAACGLA